MASRPTRCLLLLALCLPPATLPSLAAPASESGAWQHQLGADNLATAVAAVCKAAEAGDVRATFVAGVCNDLGLGMPIDHDAAREMLAKAVAGNDALAVAYQSWREASGFGESSEAQSADDSDRLRRVTALRSLPASREDVPAYLAQWLTTDGGGCRPRFKRLLVTLTERAESGDPIAQANMAAICLEPQWQAGDFQMHVFWLRRAASAGYLASIKTLALYREEGVGMSANRAEALDLLRQAAASGDAECCFDLAEKLTRSEAENIEAVKWYRQALSQGHAKARNELITLLREGRPGVPVDHVEARRLGKEGMALGQAGAATQYADLLNRGDGGPQDMQAALAAYTRASELGAPRATCMVGWMYLKGETGKKDFTKAREWLEKAAAQGQLRAIRELAGMYENALGVSQDKAKAFSLYEQAAREGESWSQNHLGWMLRNGHGVPRDDEEAVEWFRVAAKQGLAVADANLGYHYRKGLGVPKDYVKASEFLAKSLRQEDDDWAMENWNLLFESDEQRDALDARLLALLEDPKLLESEGPLPEACLSALVKHGDSGELQEALKVFVPKLERAGRTASSPGLAMCAFLGIGRAYDPVLALAYAGRIESEDRNLRNFVTAQIESICATDKARKRAAWQTLERLAQSGYKDARKLLAHRQATEEGVQPNSSNYDAYVKEFSLPLRVKHRGTSRMAGKQQVRDSELPAIISERLRGKTDAPPEVVWQEQPVYPYSMHVNNQGGQVLVSFIVDEHGEVVEPTVQGDAHPLLADAAVRAVARWMFVPGVKGGKPVNTRLMVPIVFNVLGDDDNFDDTSVSDAARTQH